VSAVPLLGLLAFAVALGSAGCAITASSVPTGPELPERPEGAPVAVFYGRGPDIPSVQVGLIHVRSIGGTLSEVVAEAQAEARELGADAIVIDLRYHYHSLPVHFDGAGRPYVDPTPKLNARATALSFCAPPQVLAPASAPPEP
jgi:hypothetical protein